VLPRGKEDRLFQTTGPIATNKPSYLMRRSNRLPFLADLPAGCVFRDPTTDLFTVYPDPLPFAAGATVGAKGGRILVLADHSLFINGMMLQEDNGNFQFAYNCLKWLREGPEGKRDRVLFADEGKVVTDFTVPLRTLPAGPISPVDMANRLIGAV